MEVSAGNKRFRDLLARGEFVIKDGVVSAVACPIREPPALLTPKRRRRGVGGPASRLSPVSEVGTPLSSSAYPSSASEWSEVPSMEDVLEMKVKPKVVKKGLGKKARTAPTYTNCIWPRQKPA